MDGRAGQQGVVQGGMIERAQVAPKPHQGTVGGGIAFGHAQAQVGEEIIAYHQFTGRQRRLDGRSGNS
jgi:hypothetical protein